MRPWIDRGIVGVGKGLRAAHPRLTVGGLAAALVACSLTNKADDLTGGPRGAGQAGTAGVAAAGQAGVGGSVNANGGEGGATAGQAGTGTGGAAGSAGGASGSGGAGLAGGDAGSAGTGAGGTAVAGAGGDVAAAGSAGDGGSAGNSAGGSGGAAGAGGGGGGGAAGKGGSGGSGGQAGTTAGAAGASGSADCPPNDPDCDGISTFDNCPLVANPSQDDQDSDKIGDACDDTPGGPDGMAMAGTCGPGAGTPWAEIGEAPTAICPGTAFSVAFSVGGEVDCTATNKLVAYRVSPTGLAQTGTVIATSVQPTGSFAVGTVNNLDAGDYWLEVRSGQTASKRVPLHVRGVTVKVSAPNDAALEAGAIPVSYTVTEPAGVTVEGVKGGIDGQLVTLQKSPFSVTPTQPGSVMITVSVTSSDGCTSTDSDVVDVRTCNPKLDAKTALSTDSPSSGVNVLVCPGTADPDYTTGGGSKDIYVLPGASAKTSGIRTVWVAEGATLSPSSSGIVTILYVGTKPTVAGIPTYLACPSITFDESLLAQHCAVP
jgi:hypothetical protein